MMFLLALLSLIFYAKQGEIYLQMKVLSYQQGLSYVLCKVQRSVANYVSKMSHVSLVRCSRSGYY
jgi:uncharacterized alkaline shock family protein YloU